MLKHILRSVFVVSALSVLLVMSACTWTIQPEGEMPAAEPSEAETSNDLAGTTWYWVETLYGDDISLVANDPSRYSVTFNADGMVAVQLDCNQGSAEYTVDGSRLAFGPVATTMMACPADSQDAEFGADLAEVNSYVMEDGHLYLAMKLDSGIMEFAPMAEMPAAEPSEAEMSNDLAGTSWQWEQSIYEGNMMLLVNDPSRYTITFNADGTVAVMLDCNRGNGSYVVDGSNLTFGPIASTRMACPPDSQDAAFSEDLAAVASFVLADGNLHLTLGTDGVMEFSPVE